MFVRGVHPRPAVMFGRWIAADGVLGSVRMVIRVRSYLEADRGLAPLGDSLRDAPKLAVHLSLRRGTAGWPTEKDGSNERTKLRRKFYRRGPYACILCLASLQPRRGRGGTQPAKSRRRRTTRARPTGEAITAALAGAS